VQEIKRTGFRAREASGKKYAVRGWTSARYNGFREKALRKTGKRKNKME